MKKLFAGLALLPFISVAAFASAPAPAAAVGYNTQTFISTFSSDIDVSNSHQSGFNWYIWNLMEESTSNSTYISNSSPLVLSGDTTGPNAEIATVTNITSSTWRGHVFGGGAYIETTVKFDPSKTALLGTGHPAFWMLPIDVLTGTAQWVGQTTGYIHYIEFDPLDGTSGWRSNSNLHEWYGLTWTSNSSNGFVTLPAGTDFKVNHTWAALWVPATSGTSGYVQYYFDGATIGSPITWSQYTNQSPPPTGQGWAYGYMDTEKFALILGTGVGMPMTITQVDVWQASTANNLTQ